MKYPTAADMRMAPPHGGRHPEGRLLASYVIEESGCWRWTKALTSSGYGHFHFRGAYYQAHRLVYGLHRGLVPDGLIIDHLCRNRACVNPTHMEPVTHRENTRRGVGTLLNQSKADAIRGAVASGNSQRVVARWFGVDHSTVSRIVNGSRWALDGVAA